MAIHWRRRSQRADTCSHATRGAVSVSQKCSAVVRGSGMAGGLYPKPRYAGYISKGTFGKRLRRADGWRQSRRLAPIIATVRERPGGQNRREFGVSKKILIITGDGG